MINTITRTYDVVGNGVNKLDVEIRYEKGGFNCWYYEQQARGYYFSLSPYELVDHGSYYSKTITVTGGSHGAKTCILPCERQSKKRFEQAASMMDDLIERYMATWLGDNGIELVSNEYTESTRER